MRTHEIDPAVEDRMPPWRVFGVLLATLFVFLLAACQNNMTAPTQPSSNASSSLDPALVTQGRLIYQENCAACHGPNGEGQPNWKVANPDGTYPAPPHTVDGHTWHHGDGLLFQIIKEGGKSLNIPNFKSGMPAFGDKLTDEEIVAVLTYIKSLWPEEQRRSQAQISQQDPLPVTP